MKTPLFIVCACACVGAAWLASAAPSDAERMVSSLLATSNDTAAASATDAVTNAVSDVRAPVPPGRGDDVSAAPGSGDTARVSAPGDEPEVSVDTSTGPKRAVTNAPAARAEGTEVSIFGAGLESNIALRVYTSRTGTIDQVDETHYRALAPEVKPGWIVGKVTDHAGNPLRDVKVALFTDARFKSMPTTRSGSFGFSVPESNTYSITATLDNQFYYTNLFLLPAEASLIVIRFRLPITVYGQFLIDGKPAQYGLLMRLVSPQGTMFGSVVLSNGLFEVKHLTPGRYTMVLERRKQFIDRRIDENRFYYVPLTFTSETMRISLERDRRSLSGTVKLNGLPQRHLDALVVLKDAMTGGKLIHREAYTYTEGGKFFFNHVQPGAYLIQVIQTGTEWHTPEMTNVVDQYDRAKVISIDVRTEEAADVKRLEDLRNQFMPDGK